MTTKRGIELDLKESNYVIDLYGFRFYFSSKFYLRKFKNGVISFVNLENSKLRNRYKIPIFLNSYFAISFYKKIEKRGFRVVEKETKKELTEEKIEEFQMKY